MHIEGILNYKVNTQKVHFLTAIDLITKNTYTNATNNKQHKSDAKGYIQFGLYKSLDVYQDKVMENTRAQVITKLL